MEQSSFSATSRRNADKNLLAILLAGVGGSLVFHIAAIAGVAHWWKPVVAIDEPMEITMVDTDTEKPPEKPVPQPTVTPIVKTPLKVEPQPKPVPIVKTPDPEPVPIVKVPAKLEPKPVPIVKVPSSLDRFIEPVPTKTANKLAPKSVEPPLKALTPPAFPDELFKPAQPQAKTPVAPKPKVTKSPTFTTPQPQQQPIATEPQPDTPSAENQSGLASNLPTRKLANPATATPTPIQDEDFGQVKPSKVITPTEEIATNNNNQSGLAGKSTSDGKLGSRLASNNLGGSTGNDDNFDNVIRSKVNSPTNDDFRVSSNNQSGLSGKPTGGGKLGSRLASNNPGGSTGNDGDLSGVTQGNSWRGARAEPGAGLQPNPGTPGDDADSGKAFGLQCLKRCEISGLTDLEDRDGGKDKLRIAIAIDPKGNVTSATIAKSSGNSTIDRLVINGVKQMQFSPPGKIVKRVVKANILL